MRFSELIIEAPIAGIETHNLDSAGSFTPFDRSVIKKSIINNVYVEKLKRIPFDLYVYILNVKGLDDLAKTNFEKGDFIAGEVDLGRGPVVTSQGNKKLFKIPEIELVIDTVKKNLDKNPSAVHLILGDNFSDGKVTLTPWMLIHRLLHTYAAHDEFDFDLETKYLKGYRPEDDNSNVLTWWDVPMMKSVVNSNYESGFDNEIELFMEMAVEYIYTGNIRVNEKRIKEKCDATGKNFNRIINYIRKQLKFYMVRLDAMIESMKGTVRYI